MINMRFSIMITDDKCFDEDDNENKNSNMNKNKDDREW